jgi:hypothetical protein
VEVTFILCLRAADAVLEVSDGALYSGPSYPVGIEGIRFKADGQKSRGVTQEDRINPAGIPLDGGRSEVKLTPAFVRSMHVAGNGYRLLMVACKVILTERRED